MSAAIAPKSSEPLSALALVPQPEPGLSPAELLKRATDLREELRASQAQCETEGRVTDAIARRLIDAGLFRIMQPRCFGGYEADVATFYRVAMEVARGCSETGWVFSLVGGHTMLVARFPIEAQIEIYGPDGDFRCPAALTPPGRADTVADGYVLNNNWVSASGIDLGTHFMGLAFIDGDPAKGMIQAIVEISQCEIVDDWQVMGMRGTGSKQVRLKDAFVPEYRTIRVDGMARGAEPFEPAPFSLENPVHCGRLAPFLVGETAAVAVGAARGALDLYEELLCTKKSPAPPFQERRHDPASQHSYGKALALVATAEAALIRSGDDYMEFSREHKAGEAAFDDARELQLVLVSQQCVNLAWKAIDLIYRTAGTTASAKVGAPIGRITRNIAVMRTHPVLQHERTRAAAARVALGLPRD